MEKTAVAKPPHSFIYAVFIEIGSNNTTSVPPAPCATALDKICKRSIIPYVYSKLQTSKFANMDHFNFEDEMKDGVEDETPDIIPIEEAPEEKENE
mgnify:CR=1 FL=1